MFYADRWAQAFVQAAGTNAEEACAVLQALITGMGTQDPRNPSAVETMIRYSLDNTGLKGNQGAEIACRVFVLLERKHFFKYRNELLAAISRIIDRNNGVVTISLESAFPVENEKELRQEFAEKLNTQTVVLQTSVNPDLMGGYRLRIGSETIDASLRTLTEDLARYLTRSGGIA
ncbi:hypothetical protein FACS1894172_09040 [Spirochaetia bacterium]|nr:hypothetical protein FACS1894164_01010 [Spirochaetia bacterium]GHU32429.1 hypothetical protein FACS1894172_09040 [Spirochaetia bacterium]